MEYNYVTIYKLRIAKYRLFKDHGLTLTYVLE
jgi:hypothetical protein